ncbi:CPBP family intramembrane glutamic endopeptidase [Paenibacillus sedimenti]|uniref:CPBP family intramembrane metalloprotease n=1 Tax=Paenibacillus sedimenti TaxID=2770274 RepID=A0A926KPX1_9BACL|nr:type II CAAX endopeptidase family protein [Paenibacillus sedimenti]MBD0380766.1 CPBP family intramembrane metalloprotease [Paenibacillus sedimenti]
MSAVFIIIITVLLSIIAAVIAILRQPTLEMGIAAIAKDAFFIKAALWAQIIGFIGGVMAAYAIFERRKGWSMGMSLHQFWKRAGEGLASGAILITISCGLIWLFGGVKLLGLQWNSTIAMELFWGFVLFIGVATNEELFARGYLQGLVKARFGAVAAVTVSTIVFALLHSFNPGMWSTPMPILNLLLAGLLFGVSREWSGGLWMPIGMHLSWNFLQGNVYGFEVSGTQTASIVRIEESGSTLLSGGSFGAEGSLITSVIILLGIAFLYKYYRRTKFDN